MPQDTPLLTNATDTRFLFGIFRLNNDVPEFDGSVVFGTGLTYDAVTGLPTGGEIYRIAHQTRSETDVLATHETIDYPGHDVALLNHVYDDQPTAWFDPAALFLSKPKPVQKTATAIELGAGDVITSTDLRGIFGKQPRGVNRLARRFAVDDSDFLDIDVEGTSAIRTTA